MNTKLVTRKSVVIALVVVFFFIAALTLSPRRAETHVVTKQVVTLNVELDEDVETTDESDVISPMDVFGDIVVSGSSTVYPLTERMAERFRNEGYGDAITIDSIGSGGGFERLCVSGEIDIANASRPIKESEVASCRSIGLEPIEFRVGTDALVLIVSKENDFVHNLTLEEITLLFSDAEFWSEINPDWPTKKIEKFSPGTDSGTFDYFVEEIFDKDEALILASTNLQLSENDNVLVQGVKSNPYAIGYFGYAYFNENRDVLTAVNIEGVEPSNETVNGGKYALARPLFVYSGESILEEKPQVQAFIDFYMAYVNEEIFDVGYFPITE